MTSKLPRLIGSLAVVAALAAPQLSAASFGVKSVGSIRTQSGQTEVAVVFNEPVEAATGANVGNYVFSAGVTATAARLLTGLPARTDPGIPENPAPVGRIYDNECVILTVTGLNAGAAASVTIQNVRSAAGETIAQTTSAFTDSGYTYVDVGVHPGPGKVIPIGNDGFDIYSNGRTQWSDEDQITFAYKQVSGDFDARVRVEFQDFSSRWARAGMIAREVLNAGEDGTTQDTTASRYVSVHANPVRGWTDAGGALSAANNQHESHFRDTVGGETASTANTPPPYPNAWIRITRTNEVVTTWRSPDAQNWTVMATRTVTPAWNSSLFVGPSFSPETGNVDASYPDRRDRFHLAQIRFNPIVTPLITSFDANPVGFIARIQDNQTAVNPATVRATLNGTPVTVQSSKQGAVTTVTYTAAEPLPLGSNNRYVLEFEDTAPTPATITGVFNYVANYTLIPASYALATPPTNPGMVVSKVFQTSVPRTPGAAQNNTPTAEQQLAGGLVDPANGSPLPNIAEDDGPINIGGDPDAGIFWTANLNWEQASGDINANPPQPDNFNSTDPAGSAGLYANEFVPGVLLDAALDPNNFTVETIAYVNLKRGFHRWGVNSDDGFKVSVAPGQPSVLGLVLGEYNGGRGASDTTFDFVAEADGYYPIRLLWWEGDGGANCEWFSVNPATGQKTLIGDVANNPSTAYAAFRAGQGRARVQSILPAPEYTGASAQPTIRIEIVNGRTSYVAGSARLAIDGAPVTPTVQGTVISYTPPAPLPRDTEHTVEFVWNENTTPVSSWTNNWTFRVAPLTVEQMPADSPWIEIEDFDYNGGQTVAAASTMPYAGGAYNGLLATLNVDYFDDQNDTDPAINTVYRGDRKPNHANLTAHTGTANLAQSRPGGFTATANYRLGWAGNFWGNYTRSIPAGTYRAYAALSHGDGVGVVMRAPLSKVTAGGGTTSQTLERLGTFRGAGSTGWGNSVLVPLRSADSDTSPLAAVKFPGGPVTLRFEAANGDADWFVFVRDTSVPASLKSLSPAEGAIEYRNVQIQAVLEDFGTAVVQASIKLSVNGVDVTAQANVSKVADLTTVTYDPGLLAADATHTYTLEFKDNGLPANTTVNTVTFTTHLYPGTPAGTIAIEAEDFDYASGQTVAAANTMPYLGGAYSNLVPVLGVDYQDNGNDDGVEYYRTNLRPNNPNMNGNLGGRLGADRGNWTVTTNYKIGWTGAGDWYNYTRIFPAGAYEVYAALSHDSATTGNENNRASLDRVTAGVGTATQTLQALGVFRAPGSGGWGQNRLVPLTVAVGDPQKVVLNLSGTATLRLNADSGDLDYLLFVPTGAAPPPEFTSVVINANGSITVTWEGNGVLEAAPDVTGPWGAIEGATSPFTFEPTDSRLFGRIKN